MRKYLKGAPGLLRMRRPFSEREGGFTLIELLAVIAIIGVLGSVVLTSLTIAREKSRDGKRVAQISQITRALESYFDVHQSYPSTTPLGYSGDDAGIKLIADLGFLPPNPIPPVGIDPTYIYRGVYTSGGTVVECDSSVPLGTVCSSYELGITLERTDNAVLENDVDQGVGAFFGVGARCASNTAGPEQCYDVKP